jgi:hypothetical protein
MQIFVLQEFGPPSPELDAPLSGKVNGGNVSVPASPMTAVDPSSPDAAASSEGALESSELTLPPPPPLPLPLPPPELEPELEFEQLVQSSPVKD